MLTYFYPRVLVKEPRDRLESGRTSRGFTLLELAIVMTIIGLLIGGVFGGLELIKSARILAQIAQISKYQTAVQAFESKYGELPGDISARLAAEYQMSPRSGGRGSGDGNGLVEAIYWSGGPMVSSTICGETALFWNDLSFAQLIPGSYSGTDGNGDIGSVPCNQPTTLAQVLTIVPAGQLGNSIISVYESADTPTAPEIPDNVRNYFQIVSAFTYIDLRGRPNGGNAVQDNFPITPIQASQLDGKLDDGLPLSGNVQARQEAAPGTYILNIGLPCPAIPAAPAIGVCVSNVAGNPYNTDQIRGGNSHACSLRFAFD